MFKAHPLSALVLPAPVDLQREAHFQMVQTARFSLADWIVQTPERVAPFAYRDLRTKTTSDFYTAFVSHAN